MDKGGNCWRQAFWNNNIVSTASIWIHGFNYICKYFSCPSDPELYAWTRWGTQQIVFEPKSSFPGTQPPRWVQHSYWQPPTVLCLPPGARHSTQQRTAKDMRQQPAAELSATPLCSTSSSQAATPQTVGSLLLPPAWGSQSKTWDKKNWSCSAGWSTDE